MSLVCRQHLGSRAGLDGLLEDACGGCVGEIRERASPVPFSGTHTRDVSRPNSNAVPHRADQILYAPPHLCA